MNFLNLSRRPLYIIDMDNTKTDFTGQFAKGVIQNFPPGLLDKADRSKYWIQESFPEEYHKPLDEMICSPGFFRDMEPIEGALEAIAEMLEMGIEVFICTAPHYNSKHCINEKIEWIEKYLGKKFLQKLIIAKDKTMVHGDILIDDNPEIVGENENPSWTHVVFHAPYNIHLDTPHRLEFWRDWKDVTLPIIEQKLKSPR